MTGEFSGFPHQTLTFLAELEKNNNKEWFGEHRAHYDQFWVEVGNQFIVAAGRELGQIREGIHADPRINGSMFRINRDLRFSKDKRPYKEHLDLWFWEGERKTAISGFYFRLTPTTVYAGSGAHKFSKQELARYRTSVADKKQSAVLARAIAKIPEGVSGETYKRTPIVDGPMTPVQEQQLRHSALFTAAEREVGSWVGSRDVVDWAANQWKLQAPMHAWLVDNLGA
jgi:uncharacterized protein (TIGR02453 family)